MSSPAQTSIPVATETGTMFVQNVRGNVSDFFSDDEVVAIVYALRERSERLSAQVWSVGYANFLSVMAMKMASLTDFDFTDDEVAGE